MRQFTVSGYLIGVDAHRLIIKVIDEDIERIALIKTIHKKNDQLGNFITINSKYCKAWNITNLDWKEPSDLIGVQLNIKCTTRTFTFRKKIDDTNSTRLKNGNNDNYIPTSTPMILVSFQADDICNH